MAVFTLKYELKPPVMFYYEIQYRNDSLQMNHSEEFDTLQEAVKAFNEAQITATDDVIEMWQLHTDQPVGKLIKSKN